MMTVTPHPSRVYLVAQLGARRHYAVPRALASIAQLAFLYTDICANIGWPKMLRAMPSILQPTALRRLLERRPEGIPNSKIRHFSAFGLQYAVRLRRAKSNADRYETYLWGAHRFNELILRSGFGTATGVYTFNSAGLELLERARDRGLATVLDQTIAPLQTEAGLLKAEHSRFPDWEEALESNPHQDEYMERNRCEWAVAQRIICGSEFVRESIAACGGPAERCRVVPYGYDPAWTPEPRTQHGGPLRVLYAGIVGLRKGAPYVLEAAKRMKGRAEFRLIGPVYVKGGVAKELASCTDLRGSVQRDEVRAHYQWADIFLLPSLCEGAATVTYEALAAGLPVICTPNTGSVVRDGVDGYLVPIRDTNAIVDRLELLASSTELRNSLGEHGRARAAEFSVAKYGERLTSALHSAGW